MRHEPAFIGQPQTLKEVLGPRLLSVPAASLAAMNKLADARPRWKVACAGTTVDVAWTSYVPSPQTFDQCIEIGFDAGSLSARFSSSLLEEVFGARVDFDASDTQLFQLLVQHLLTSPITIDGKELGKPLSSRFAPVPKQTDVASTSLALRVADGKAIHFVALTADAAVLDLFLPTEAVRCVKTKRLSVSLSACMRSQDFFVVAADLRAIAAGDLLYLESASLLSQERGLFLSGSRFAGLEATAAGFRVKAPLDLQRSRRRVSPMIKKDSETFAPGTAVPLSIEFGQISLSLDQVAGLTDGSIVDFGEVSLNDVTLRAGERAVASGSLVEIGEGVGLRITKVF